MDAEHLALLREQQRIRAEQQRDAKRLDGFLTLKAREAIGVSLELLRRTTKIKPDSN